MVTETLEAWRAVPEINFDFISAELWADYPRLYVRLIDGRTEVSQQSDLCVLFEQAHAFTLHEEFVHPTQETVFGRAPKISRTNSYTFPLLKVTGSLWMASIKAELDLKAAEATHYRLCTGFPVIDVVSNVAPTVYWLSRKAPAEDADPPGWAQPEMPSNSSFKRTRE